MAFKHSTKQRPQPCLLGVLACCWLINVTGGFMTYTGYEIRSGGNQKLHWEVVTKSVILHLQVC